MISRILNAADGWLVTIVGGLVLGVLACLPSVDGAAWRGCVRALPWLLLAGVLSLIGLAVRWAW